MITAQEIITNLTDGLGVSKETLASKMQVSSMSIVRWGRGMFKPDFANLKLLNQIYRGYKANVRSRKKSQ